ncbi:MAG: hypothetical protein IPM59_00365 [Chloracidobacterium sp.]|nr:hypothetical protein [Chloracidobacterium sp.]
MKRGLFIALALLFASTTLIGQPKPIEKEAPSPASLPPAFEARYEGGIFGSAGKETGLLKFDDTNLRVVFYKKSGTEMFAIPYDSLIVVYPDSKEGITRTGNVASRLPVPGAGLFGLMTKKTKYLVLNFNDPDIEAAGTANFKFDEKDDLLLFINALGTKAKMTQRGDAYYRPKRRDVF